MPIRPTKVEAGATPIGAAGGDLSGTYPSPSVNRASISDAATNTNTDVLVLNHQTSGVASAGFSTGLLFRGETGTGEAFDIARISANEATVTLGGEKGGLDFWVRTGGAVLAKKWQLSGSGNWVLDADNTYSIGSSSLRMMAVNALSFRVHNVAGDANRISELNTFGLGLGIGGATTMDWFLAHSATALRADMTTGNILGAVGVGGFACRTLSADVNPTSSMTTKQVAFGAGGATAVSSRLLWTAANTMQYDNAAGGAAFFSFIGTLTTQGRNGAVVSKTFATAPLGTPYAAVSTDETIFVDPVGGNCEVLLPTAATPNIGRIIIIKRTTAGVNTVTVTATGTLDGAANYVLPGGTLQSISIRSDGSNWWIV